MSFTTAEAVQAAKRLKTALQKRYNLVLKHGQALDLLAQTYGLKDWNVLSARLRETSKPLPASVPGIHTFSPAGHWLWPKTRPELLFSLLEKVKPNNLLWLTPISSEWVARGRWEPTHRSTTFDFWGQLSNENRVLHWLSLLEPFDSQDGLRHQRLFRLLVELCNPTAGDLQSVLRQIQARPDTDWSRWSLTDLELLRDFALKMRFVAVSSIPRYSQDLTIHRALQTYSSTEWLLPEKEIAPTLWAYLRSRVEQNNREPLVVIAPVTPNWDEKLMMQARGVGCSLFCSYQKLETAWAQTAQNARLLESETDLENPKFRPSKNWLRQTISADPEIDIEAGTPIGKS